jgi:hypothetical protein
MTKTSQIALGKGGGEGKAVACMVQDSRVGASISSEVQCKVR